MMDAIYQYLLNIQAVKTVPLTSSLLAIGTEVNRIKRYCVIIPRAWTSMQVADLSMRKLSGRNRLLPFSEPVIKLLHSY